MNTSSAYAPLNLGLTKWTAGLMWVNVVAQSAIALSAFNLQGSLDGSISAAVDAENLYFNISGLSVLAWVPTFVLLVVLIAKSHTSTSSLLHPDDKRKYSQGWSIGVWFIPFANIFSTPQVFIENARIANANRMNGKVDRGWKQQESDKQVIWWFLLFWIGLAASRGGAQISNSALDVDSYRGGLVLLAIGSLSSAAGIAFGALHIRRVGETLAENSNTHQPSNLTANPAGHLPPPSAGSRQSVNDVPTGPRPQIPVNPSSTTDGRSRPSIPVVQPPNTTEIKE